MRLNSGCVSLSRLLLKVIRNCPTDPYKKFAGFYTRSQDAFVNYSLVLDAAMSLEVKEFGDLTEGQYVSLLLICIWFTTTFLC